ncbi:hypothetical protein KAX75_11385 [candidate division WOR-3 bacterium]|nr:hypothetical protein [candidate division WOR-3 bacterium]
MTDKLLELATKLGTKNIDEQIVRIERLNISIDKVLITFSKRAKQNNVKKVQESHLQAIEYIFYQDLDVFTDESTKNFLKNEFFLIKDRLDSGILDFPLYSKEHENTFVVIRTVLDILKEDLLKRAETRKFLIILLWCLSLGIIIPFGLIILLGQVIDSSIWKFLITFTIKIFQYF